MVNNIDEIPKGLSERLNFGAHLNVTEANVRWSALKSLWWTLNLWVWLFLGLPYFTFGALLLWIGLLAISLCLGHSIGMHRLLIHESFETFGWLKKLLVTIGTFVGMGGPFTMMYNHDVRDYAQRKEQCHPFLSHNSSILRDFWWQLHCKLHIKQDLNFKFPDELSNDNFYVVLQNTSILLQGALGFCLYLLGGWGWFAWGISGRVVVAIFGHWLIGYFAHNKGQRDWHVEGASVQGHNIAYTSILTFGENWHNNHHAFPNSARLGIKEGQLDPGWIVLKMLERLGLVWDLKTPADLPMRTKLTYIGE